MQENAQKSSDGTQRSLKNLQQQAAERQKIRCRAQRNLQKEAKAELALPRIERKSEHRQEKDKRKQPVRKTRSAGQDPSQRAQQIIQHRKQDPQQCREHRLLCLKEDRQLHQPNSRARKLPAGWLSS